MDSSRHVPVMLEESIKFLNIKSNGVYVDCTFGSGGHSRRILEALGQDGRLIAFDCDKTVAKWTEELKSDHRFTLIFDNFSNLLLHLRELNLESVDGFLFDLGLSSMQLEKGRGFSYRDDDYPLDMRMNNSLSLTAEQVVNNYSQEQLANIFFNLGEERHSFRLASKIVEFRRNQTVSTVDQLVKLIISSLGKKVGGSHPAKKIFQALRIEVNNELSSLKSSLFNASQLLSEGGRIVVISYHSLEDRITKLFFKEQASSEPNSFSIVNKKVVIPSWQETLSNRRSRSAKMRVLSK